MVEGEQKQLPGPIAMPNPPRRHHFVPRFLLDKFTGDCGLIWTYDAARNTSWSSKPSGTGYERDLNSVRLQDGVINHSMLEEFCDHIIENPAAPAIGGLISRRCLASDEWESFIVFVAAQILRTPSSLGRTEALLTPVMQESFRRGAAYNEEFRSRVTARLLKEGTPQERIDELLNLAARGEMKMRPSKELLLRSVVELVGELADLLGQMKWAFHNVHPSDEDLVIGDHPVILRDVGPEDVAPGPLGLTNPNIEVMLPLSKRMVALAHWEGPVSYGTLKEGQANFINYHTCRNALNYIYAPRNSTDLLNNFVKVFRTGPKVTIERIEQDGKLGFKATFQ